MAAEGEVLGGDRAHSQGRRQFAGRHPGRDGDRAAVEPSQQDERAGRRIDEPHRKQGQRRREHDGKCDERDDPAPAPQPLVSNAAAKSRRLFCTRIAGAATREPSPRDKCRIASAGSVSTSVSRRTAQPAPKGGRCLSGRDPGRNAPSRSSGQRSTSSAPGRAASVSACQGSSRSTVPTRMPSSATVVRNFVQIAVRSGLPPRPEMEQRGRGRQRGDGLGHFGRAARGRPPRQTGPRRRGVVRVLGGRRAAVRVPSEMPGEVGPAGAQRQPVEPPSAAGPIQREGRVDGGAE